jgi:hypothetical protein
MQPEAAADAECTQPASTDVSATIEMSFFMDGLLRFQCPNFAKPLEHRTALAPNPFNFVAEEDLPDMNGKLPN